MCPAKAKDPKTFIQIKGLPIPSHQGLRIQARSDTHYNCETPGREEVFYKNYVRRQKQKDEQGYNSVNYKPYQLVGEPMYLEEKKLMLHGLGQLDENALEESSGSSDEEVEESNEKEKNENTPGVSDDQKKDPSRKFVVKRNIKTRKSLANEVSVGRKMVNWTKLGHGVFNMIREQDEERLNAEENERKQMEERWRTEWQPPTAESSDDDETDEELAKEEDLSIFMADQSEMRKEVSFLGIKSTAESEMPTIDLSSRTTESRFHPTAASGKLAPSALTPGGARSATSRATSGTKKKKRRNLEDARPYTPCRTNISLELYDDRPNRTALFRQLCALNWILEAMISEPPVTMEPIIKCWNIKYNELKQNTFCKTTLRKQKNEKALETRWNSFVTNPGAGHLRTKPNKPNLGASLTVSSAMHPNSNRIRRMSTKSGVYRLSGVTGSAGSGASGEKDGSGSRKGSVASREEASPARRDSVGKRDGNSRNDALPKSKGLTVFLNEIYESASNLGAKPIDDEEIVVANTPPERPPSTTSGVFMTIKSRQPSGNRRNSAGIKNKPILSAKQLEQREKQVNKPPELHISKWVANTNRKLHTRARSASIKEPKVVFPSHKHSQLTPKMRNNFADVTEDNALMLHDKLEAMEKRRLRRSEEKFRAIRTSLHISAQLELLKTAGQEPDDEEEKQQLKFEDESKWFRELMQNLPPNIMEDRQCSAVVGKLQSMGRIESRKVTPQKFLDILATLKPWELCAPDISAAIEFVRDKVVGMSVEDFEGWYRSEVPGIVRSQSVPLCKRECYLNQPII